MSTLSRNDEENKIKFNFFKMIGFIKFNNHDIVGNLKNKEFDLINKKNNKPYKTIVLCGQNGSGKTTFINYFRITKNNEHPKDYYEKYIDKAKWIIEEKFLKFEYYKADKCKKYRAYCPIRFSDAYKYPLSTIHDDNEYINDNKWEEFSNFIFCDFSNQKRSNQASFKYSPQPFSLMKNNYNETQYQEKENFLRRLERNFRSNTFKANHLIKITNWVLTFLQTELWILPPYNASTYYEFSSTIGIDKNQNDLYGLRWLIIKKNGEELVPNEISTGEWQLIINIMMLTEKIIEFYETNKSFSEYPIIFFDQPEDNLNPKLQLELISLYKILRRTLLKDSQFFIITHSVYFISEFLMNNDSIVWNFNNYKPLSYGMKNGPLIVYNLDNHLYPSWDEIIYLIDQIPSINVYCSLYEILNHHCKKKYKSNIKEFNKNKPKKERINGIEWLIRLRYGKEMKNVKCENHEITYLRDVRNYFIHKIFSEEESEKLSIGFNELKSLIDFLRFILYEEKKNSN